MERGGGEGAGGKYCSSERANDAQESRFVMGRDETLSLPFFLLLLPPLSRWGGIHRFIFTIELSHFVGLFFCIVNKYILSIGESLPYRMNRGGKRGKLCNNLLLLCSSSSQSVAVAKPTSPLRRGGKMLSLYVTGGGGRRPRKAARTIRISNFCTDFRTLRCVKLEREFMHPPACALPG